MKPLTDLVSLSLIVLLFSACCTKPTSKAEPIHSTCPQTQLQETPLDCPWADLTRQVLAGSPFVKSAPSSLLDQLDRDAQTSVVHTLWGISKNQDESNPNDLIVPIQVLKPMISLAKSPLVDIQFLLVPAGITHTYGYLFSPLKTPYGYKRARWVQGEIEAGFGLPSGLFGPNPPEGTLYQNLTYFIGQTSFAQHAKFKGVFKQMKHSVASQIQNFAYFKLKPLLLKEQIEKSGITLSTFIVPFLNHSSDSSRNSALLIYAVQISAQSSPQLITAFPVNRKFIEKITAPSNLGKNQLIQSKYNAFIENFSNTSGRQGIRTLIQTP